MRKLFLLFLLFLLFFLLLLIFFNEKRSENENYDENGIVLEKEKTIDAQNLNPSTQTTEKKDFEKIINRLKKYTDNPVKKINIPIYFINMDKNPDRKEFMENQLQKFSNNFNRIKGFNGYKIKNKLYDTVEGVTFRNNYVDLSNAEIGCLMSHIIAIKTAYDNGNDIALILEDDTIVNLINMLDFDFDAIYNDAPENWEVINLFHMSNWQIDMLKSSYNHTKEYKYLKHDRSVNYLYSAVGYIINRKGMKKIIDYAYQGKNKGND